MSNEVRLKYTKVLSKVDKAIKEGYTIVSAQGSSRSGKTYNILLWLIYYALNNRGVRISVVRKTLPSLKASVLVDFKDILMKAGLWSERFFNKTEMIYTFQNGSSFEFFSTDSEEKLRGRKRDILFVNEATELKYIEYQQLAMRTDQFIIVDYNPSFSDDHWLNKLNKDSRTYHFITTYKDNPYLPKAVIDEIESLQWKNQSLWKVYGLGIQALIEGLIFPDFELVDYFPDHCRNLAIGMDLGYTNDPTAIVRCGIVGDNLYIDELCYKTRMSTGDIINELKKYRIKVVSEVDNRLIDEVYSSGVNIHKVNKGAIMTGIIKMQSLKICVTKNSTNIIKELKNYTYAQDKEGKFINEPIDKFNHAIDAVRYYVVMELMERKASGMRVGRLTFD